MPCPRLSWKEILLPLLACWRRSASFSERSWTMRPCRKRHFPKKSYSPKSIWRSSKPDSVRGWGLIWPSPRKLWMRSYRVCCCNRLSKMPCDMVSLVEGGTIRIESKLHGAQLQIRVQNSGPASSGLVAPNEPANGIGIHNTAERLKTLYAANHKFVLQWPEPGGCEVTVELPFRKSAQQEVSSCER